MMVLRFFRFMLHAGFVIPVLTCLSCLSGCGSGPPPTVPVTGKVVLADGKPLTSGFIVLVPVAGGDWESSGQVRPDGTFQLESLGLDGARPGEYRVRLRPIPPGPRSKPAAVPRFESKYLDENTSGLQVTVPPGGGAVDIQLK